MSCNYFNTIYSYIIILGTSFDKLTENHSPSATVHLQAEFCPSIVKCQSHEFYLLTMPYSQQAVPNTEQSRHPLQDKTIPDCQLAMPQLATTPKVVFHPRQATRPLQQAISHLQYSPLHPQRLMHQVQQVVTFISAVHCPTSTGHKPGI